MERKEKLTGEAAVAMEPSDEELALRGGLHGRMASAFCTLQSSMDALQRYLSCRVCAQDQPQIQALLAEMNNRIASLERLSWNAARLATGALVRGTEELLPLELNTYLAELAECTNETLAMRGFAARIRVEDQSGEGPTWVNAGTDLLDGILMNLLSNLILVRQDGTMQLTLLPGRQLLYTDNGPGMDLALARALLEQGRPPRDILDRGALGLLLVRDYCAAMGWQLSVEPADSLQIRFSLPALSAGTGLKLQDSADTRNALLRAHLGRELDGVFGLPAARDRV